MLDVRRDRMATTIHTSSWARWMIALPQYARIANGAAVEMSTASAGCLRRIISNKFDRTFTGVSSMTSFEFSPCRSCAKF